jgi:hypothetical protein
MSHKNHDYLTVEKHLLIAENTSSGAIRRIFEYRKLTKKCYSMGFVCKKSGIPSRGYFSNILKEKRTIHLKYKKAICRGLDLRGVEAKFLQLLIESEHAETGEKTQIENLLKDFRKYFHTLSTSKILPSTTKNLFFCFQVFASIGLHNGKATIHQLSGNFSPSLKWKVIKAAFELVNLRPFNHTHRFQSYSWRSAPAL